MHSLILVLCLSLGLGFVNVSSSRAAEPAKPATTGSQKVQIDEFEKLKSMPNTIVLDVRTPEEFKAGHIEGAKNLDWKDSSFLKKAEALDKSKTYLVHCAAGFRSAQASEKLKAAGFQNVIDFTGGFSAWAKAGKPITKK